MWGRWTNLTMLCSPVINDRCLRIYIRSHFCTVIFNVHRTDFFGDSCRLCCCERSHHLSSFYTFMTCFTSVIISFENLKLEGKTEYWCLVNTHGFTAWCFLLYKKKKFLCDEWRNSCIEQNLKHCWKLLGPRETSECPSALMP